MTELYLFILALAIFAFVVAVTAKCSKDKHDEPEYHPTKHP